jgi:microsomal dipeptidase-like Zn-dependent dipeptidase
VLLAVGVAALLALGPQLAERRINRVTVPPPYTASLRARQLHDTLFVADLHADSLLWNRDLLAAASYGHVDVPRLAAGGVALQVFGVVTKVPSGLNYERNDVQSGDIITFLTVLQRWPVTTWTSLTQRALYQAGKLHDLAARSAGRLTMIQSAADLEGFLDRRRANLDATAGLLASEGLQSLAGDLANVQVLRDAGFRMMGLTHFFDNELGGSAHGVTKGGLTDFGRQVVRRMEDLQIIVDLAHASPRMIDDVLGMATRPLVVSHTGVKGTCDNVRNLSDAHARAVAATGGLIGIGYWDAAACDVSVAGIVRAIQYAARLVGADHVALGSDFDGATATPFDTTGLAQITDGLLAAGMPEEEVRKIMGGNVLRLLREVLPSR